MPLSVHPGPQQLEIIVTDEFRFSKGIRLDLMRSLRAHGCRDRAKQVVSVNTFERHAERYHHKVLIGERTPSLFSAVQAARILAGTCEALDQLDDLDPTNRRRMIRRFGGDGEGHLDDFKHGLEELCSASDYACDKACDEMGAKVFDDDQELKRLCRGIANEWKLATGRSFPALPGGNSAFLRWHEARQLQRHPLWIVMRAFHIDMPIFITSKLEKYAFAD